MKIMLSKTLVFAVIVLFVGLGVVPSIAMDTAITSFEINSTEGKPNRIVEYIAIL